MKPNFLKIIILTSGIVTQSVYPAHVFPVFTGKWTDSLKVGHQDSCGGWHFYTGNIFESKDELFKYKIDEVESRSKSIHCQILSNGIFAVAPEFFNATSRYKDWNDITVKNNNDRIPTVWPAQMDIQCADYSKNDGPFYERFTANPIYDCPKGSRLTLATDPNRHSQTEIINICSTTPNVCAADVVARDLSYPVVNVAGHVGLAILPQFVKLPADLEKNTPSYWKTDNLVLEVLNRPIPNEIINVHTLKSFQEADVWWGEVYSLPDAINPLPMFIAANIVNFGMEQQEFRPEYTYLPTWNEGTNTTTNRAKFRCDTFVEYSYLRGGNYSIPYTKIAPLNLYRAFKNQRTDVPYQGSNHVNQQDQKLSTFIDKGEMKEENLLNVDKFFVEYLNNSSISKQNKIQFLLKKAKNSKEIFQFTYIMQALGYLEPYECIPSLIDMYKTEKDTDKKVKIISTLSDALRNKYLEGKYNVDARYVQHVVKGHKFFISLLQTESNAKLLNEIISSAVIPINYENYKIIINAINRLQSMPDSQYHLSINYKYLTIIRMLFATNEMQKSALPEWLNYPFTNEEMKSFYDKLIFLIANYMKPDSIDESVKPLLKDFIVSYKEKDIIKANINGHDESRRIYVLSTLNNTNEDSRDNELVRIILDEKDDYKQARYISGMNYIKIYNHNHVLKKIPQSTKLALIEKFYKLFIEAHEYEKKSLYSAVQFMLKE